jgi:serine/threonine protein kinase
VYLEFCDNEYIALKKLKIKHISECAAEVSAMKILNHKNIRSCKDFYFSPNEILISMQYGECSLSEILYGKENTKTVKLEYWDDIYLHGHAFLTTIKKERANKFRTQILEALHHIHSHGIIHGDIKTGNIIITKDDNIQIIDFGSSICYDTGRTENRHSICAQGYRSYHLLKDFGYRRNSVSAYSTGVDIWAAACIFLELETGVFPFYGDVHGQREKIDFIVKKRKLDFLPDERLRKLYLEMFNYDEQTRISARECLRYL